MHEIVMEITLMIMEFCFLIPLGTLKRNHLMSKQWSFILQGTALKGKK